MKAYQTNREYLALLRRVCEAPLDAAPRLILSDWLEENGQEKRAFRIRHAVKAKRAVYRSIGSFMTEKAIENLDDNLADEIRTSCEVFMEFARERYSRHPIAKVRLIDKRPFEIVSGRGSIDRSQIQIDAWFWMNNNGAGEIHGLPGILTSNKYGIAVVHQPYTSETDAFDSLSNVCVAYGRECAGLSPHTDGRIKPILDSSDFSDTLSWRHVNTTYPRM